MRLNLFWKMVLFSLVLFALVAIIFKFAFEPMLADSIKGSILSSANDQVNSISKLIVQEIENECSLEKIEQLTRLLTQKDDLETNLIIPNCQTGVLAEFSRETYRLQPEIYNALGGQTSQQIKPLSPEKTIVVITAPLISQQHIVGAIQTEYYFDSVDGITSSVFKSFYLLIFALSIFSLGMAFIIWSFQKRRLKRISSLFNEIKEIPFKNENGSKSLFMDEIEELEKEIRKKVQTIHALLHSFSSNNQVFTSILEGMSDGILVVNQDRQITLINRAAADFFNVSISMAETHSIAEGIRNHEVEEIFEMCLKSQKVQTVDIEIIPDRRFIRCIATPLSTDPSDSILILIQDLTRVHQLEVIRQDFVSNVSHELRTPLASLKSLVETIQESAGRDPQASEKFLEMMNKEIDNLTQMVQELLELSKIESERVPLEKQLHSPDEIIMRAGERMRLQIERAKLELKIESNKNLSQIMVDLDRLEQVLVNLIHNSIKFTHPGGIITLKTKQENHLVIFSVNDNGIGIAPKDIERIFERFYKADRARSAPGTGLGLSIARHIVEAHGGKIWAESTRGEGSTFFFSIPMHK